jgi:hypothetical protein
MSGRNLTKANIFYRMILRSLKNLTLITLSVQQFWSKSILYMYVFLYNRVDGIWDAEKWHRSFGGGGTGSKSGSRGPSPLNPLDPRERRSEMLRRNSGKCYC